MPTKSENWGHMHAGISVWLNGPPRLLAHRVVRDGTADRPLLNDASPAGAEEGPQEEYARTLGKLEALMEARREQYAQADIVVSLEGDDPATADFGAPAAVVVHRILAAVNDRIKRDASAREERKSFQVVNENLPPTMRVVKSINPAADGGSVGGEADPYLP